MNKLITVVPADKVTAAYKKEAKKWGKWDSKSRKSFPFQYTIEERVFILQGSAEVTPDDGSSAVAVKIGKGDQVTFHKGLKCKWKVTKRMKKHFHLFRADGDDDAEDPPAIVCDVCDKDCVAESYFMAEEELDICPTCYEKDKEKYAGAEHQKEGEKWFEPIEQEEEETTPKKKRKTNK
jgi:uncharacterized cupin superfamily protein